jgi:DnaJ-class molecular chaperone
MNFGYSAYQILHVDASADLAQIKAAHRALAESVALRSDLPERVRANLRHSLDDALYTLSDPNLRANHNAWMARHQDGARIDGAHAVMLPSQPEPAQTMHTTAAPPQSWLAQAHAWLAKLRKAGSAARMASRTLL